MANQIYRTTRDGLTRLVSLRAATRVLERALRRVGLDAETVDAEAMRRLLRGKVRRELEPILPRQGLHRHLKRLDREVAAAGLAAEAVQEADLVIGPRAASPEPEAAGHEEEEAQSGAARAAEPATARPDPAPDPDEAILAEAEELLLADEPPPLMDRGEAGIPEPTRAQEPGAGAAQERPGAVAAGAAAGGPAVAVSPVRPATQDTAWQRVVEVEGVRRAMLAHDGRLLEDRGAGPEGGVALERVTSLMKLVGKCGSLRSWHVDHGAGHVLLGAANDRLLLVQGSSELNLGAIYAAFAALEEET